MSEVTRIGYRHVLVEFLRLAREVVISSQKRNDRLVHELNLHLRSIDARALDDYEKKRIKAYIAQNSIVNLHARLLHDISIARQDRKNGAYFGAFTPFMDDAMDDRGSSYREVISEVDASPEKYPSLHYLWGPVKVMLNSNRAFSSYYQDTILAQNESVRQSQSEQLTELELQSITKAKGGSSTLLYRSIVTHPISPEEEKALYALGGVYQLLNDIFDFYKDSQTGQQTLVSLHPDFYKVRRMLSESVSEFLIMFDAIPVSKLGKRRALASISIIIARGFVALDQFESLQENAPLLDIEHRERKDLIVDMERPMNLIKSLKYAARLRKIAGSD